MAKTNIKINQNGKLETYLEKLLIVDIGVFDTHKCAITCIDPEVDASSDPFLLVTGRDALIDFWLKADASAAAKIISYIKRKQNTGEDTFIVNVKEIFYGLLPINNLLIRVTEHEKVKLKTEPLFYFLEEITTKPICDRDIYERLKTTLFYRESYLIERYRLYLEFLPIDGASKARIKASLESDNLFAIAKLNHELHIVEKKVSRQENRNDSGGNGCHVFRDIAEDDNSDDSDAEII